MAMFSPIGALSAFGGGLMAGMPTGMDLRSKYMDMQAENLLGQSLQDIGGLSSIYGTTPPAAMPPGVASEPAARQAQQGIPGADMPGWQQSIPGAQAPGPEAPTPPGVPAMPGTRTAALGGAGPIPSAYSTAIKGFEGYTPVAQRDYSQYSGGFGTRARPGERLSGEEWSSRYQDELYQAAKQVDERFPGLPSGPRAALVDMTYNTGTKWMSGNLGRAVEAQDWPLAQQLMQQYVRAGGQVLPGLQARRREGASWMGGAEPSASALAAGERAEAQSRGEKTLAQARENLTAGRPLDMPQLAQLIERRAGSDASPMVKFRAMQKGYNLLNQQSQTQFNEMMRMLEYQQRERHYKQQAETAAGKQQTAEEKVAADKERVDANVQGIINGDIPPEMNRFGKDASAIRAGLEKQGFKLSRALLEWDATKKQVASLNNAQQTRLRDTSVSIVNTIDEVKHLADQLDMGGVEWWNDKKLDAYIKLYGNSEQGKLANEYRTMVSALREEILSVITGGYAPTGPAWEQANKQIREASGKDAMHTSLDTIKRLMNFRLQAVGQGGVAVPGGGTSRYAPAPPQPPGTTTTPPATQYIYDQQGKRYHPEGGKWVDDDGKPAPGQ